MERPPERCRPELKQGQMARPCMPRPTWPMMPPTRALTKPKPTTYPAISAPPRRVTKRTTLRTIKPSPPHPRMWDHMTNVFACCSFSSSNLVFSRGAGAFGRAGAGAGCRNRRARRPNRPVDDGVGPEIDPRPAVGQRADRPREGAALERARLR